jgi:hypothetical protein
MGAFNSTSGGLHEYTATAALESSSNADTAPDQVVVLHEGRAVGFFDAEAVLDHRTGFDYEAVRFFRRPIDLEIYPALSMQVAVVPDTPFEITVGFRDTPDPDLTDSSPIHVERVRRSDDCLVVLVGDPVTLDREYDTRPLRVNVLLRFTGCLKPGVADATVTALFSLNGS